MKTVAAIIFAAGIVAAQAACPNQCSGHGRCTENDSCECYRQTGTAWRQRVGYTGADCSLRTCPTAIAYDTISTNRARDVTPVKFSQGYDFTGVKNDRGVSTFLKALVRHYEAGQVKETQTYQIRISDYTDANADSNGAAEANDVVQYQWKLAGHAAYSAPANLILGTAMQCTVFSPCELLNNGEKTAKTGVYIYLDPSSAIDDFFYSGASFISGTSSTYGFEEGNTYEFTYDWQEGRPYEYGDSNLAHQESECSGRGLCDRSSGQCECFDGFNGEACQRTECPSDCSGHGVCQDLRRFAADYDSGAPSSVAVAYGTAWDARKLMGCSCDEGFRGADCTQMECPSGDDPMGGFGGDGTNVDDTAGAALDCSGRGLCDYSAGSCKCFKGYYGERCEYQTNFV